MFLDLKFETIRLCFGMDRGINSRQFSASTTWVGDEWSFAFWLRWSHINMMCPNMDSKWFCREGDSTWILGRSCFRSWLRRRRHRHFSWSWSLKNSVHFVGRVAFCEMSIRHRLKDIVFAQNSAEDRLGVPHSYADQVSVRLGWVDPIIRMVGIRRHRQRLKVWWGLRKGSEWRKHCVLPAKSNCELQTRCSSKNSKSWKTLKSIRSYQKLGVTFKTSPNLSHVVCR